MARTRTLTELISDVRIEGDYNRSAVFTDAILTRFLNQAIAEVYDLLTSANPELYATEDDSLVTVAAQDYVSLPSDFYKLLRLDVQQASGNWSRLFQYSLAEENNYQEIISSTYAGSVYRYHIQGDRVKLKPTPGVVDTLRMVYIPCVTDLVSGGDTFDGINGWEDLVVTIALRKCDLREERSTNPRDAEIARQTQRIRSASGARDSAEPFGLPDNTSWEWNS